MTQLYPGIQASYYLEDVLKGLEDGDEIFCAGILLSYVNPLTADPFNSAKAYLSQMPDSARFLGIMNNVAKRVFMAIGKPELVQRYQI